MLSQCVKDRNHTLDGNENLTKILLKQLIHTIGLLRCDKVFLRSAITVMTEFVTEKKNYTFKF